MQLGKSRPFISQAAVRKSLDSLVYASSEKDSPLLTLALVDNFLLNPDLPAFSDRRKFALNHILTSLISKEFFHYRTIFDRVLPGVIESREVAASEIVKGAKHQSLELMGWSWLYYHYVCINYNFTSQEFCELASIDSRTLRRYQQHSLKRLTDRLIEDEWAIRTEKRHRELYAELPSMGLISFVNRATERAHIHNYLVRESVAHIQITGARGVGKSLLVESILCDLINDDRIEQVVWLNKPITVNYVQQYLHERLLPEDGQISLPEYLLTYRTAIVLDDFQLQEGDIGLQAILPSLSAAIVFVCNGTSQPLPNTLSVTLLELPEIEAKSLIRKTLLNVDYSLNQGLLDSHVDEVWEVVGGNPLAIQLAVASYNTAYDRSDLTRDINILYERAFISLDEYTKYAWCVFALLPPDEYELTDLVQIIPSKVTLASLFKLLKIHVIELKSDSRPDKKWKIKNSARTYIEICYEKAVLVTSIIDGILAEDEHHPLRIVMVEYLLMSRWFNALPEQRLGWIRRGYNEALHLQHWSIWRVLLEPYVVHQQETFEADFYIAYGKCLVGLGEWESARKFFEQIVFECGRNGRFIQQAQALLELAGVLRHQGEYEGGNAFLIRAKQIANRHHETELTSAIVLEQTQILIDSKDIAAAQQLLPNLPNTLRGQILASDIYLLAGRYEESQFRAYEVLERGQGLIGIEARAHIILGRSFESQNDLSSAHEQFLLAVMKLEQQADVFGLARAQTNLGGLLLRMEYFDDAEILLLNAKRSQLILKDRVGLAVTQHNLRLLHIALSQMNKLQ